MARIFFFTKQPIEIVRILDGKLDDCRLEKHPIRLINGEEYVYSYCKFRKIRFREDGRRYLMIYLESEFEYFPAIKVRKIFDDDECCPDQR